MVRLAAAVGMIAALVAAGCQKKDADPNANASPPGQAYEDLALSAAKVAGGHDVTIAVTRREGETPRRGKVPFTAETITVSARPSASKVSEADLFGTGVAFDLDGDGDTDDELAIACDGTAALVGDTRIEPASEAIAEVTRMRYDDRVTRLGERGAYVFLYTPCTERDGVSFGISAPDEPLEVHEVRGPALQVIVFEPEELGSEPGFTLQSLARDGDAVDETLRLSYTREPIVTGAPAWHAMRWVMIPLDADAMTQTVTLQVRGGDEPRLVTASIHERGDEAAERVRSHVAATLLR